MMNRMNAIDKLRICMVIAMAILCGVSSFARTAKDVLSGCASKIATAPSLDICFVISADGKQTSGTMLVAGDAFTLTTPELCVWFDGTTQWTYLASTSEVSITEPTPDELMESNPFMILHNVDSYYNTVLVGSTATAERIKLTPVNASSSSVSEAMVLVNKSTQMPESLKATFNNGNTVDVTISKISKGKKLPVSCFKYNSSAYPAAEIIDLR